MLLRVTVLLVIDLSFLKFEPQFVGTI